MTPITISKLDILTSEIDVSLCESIVDLLPTIDSSVPDFNIWDSNINEVKSLKILFEDLANSYISNSNLKVDNGWPYVYDDYIYQEPHNHNSILFGIVYLNATKNCGDLLIQDPLGMLGLVDYTDHRITANGRISIHIKPYTGLMLVAPGMLIHSTEPKPPNESRIIIATNFYKDQ